jgi:hypothetical protein
LRSVEARHPADRRHNRERHDHVDAWNRHQPLSSGDPPYGIAQAGPATTLTEPLSFTIPGANALDEILPDIAMTSTQPTLSAIAVLARLDEAARPSAACVVRQRGNDAAMRRPVRL